MLERHLDNLKTYLRHYITQAVTEELNSKIQSLKAAARGRGQFSGELRGAHSSYTRLWDATETGRK